MMVAASCSSGDRNGTTFSPEDWPVPSEEVEFPGTDAGTAPQDVNYLEGQGAPLVVFVDTFERAVGDSGSLDADECDGLEQALSEGAAPDELAELTVAIADEPLRALLTRIRLDATRILIMCDDAASAADVERAHPPILAFHDRVVDIEDAAS